MPDAQAQLVQLFSHSGTTIAALAQSVLITDMRQKHQVTPLPVGYWPPLMVCYQTIAGQRMLPSTKATICNRHNVVSVGLGKTAAIVLKESELHGF